VLWNVSSAVADVTITICMMTLLLHAKASSCFGEMRDLLSRLIRLTLQTGLLTSILALLVVPFFIRNLVGIYSIPWYILGKSYVISLLANLNARKRSNSSVRGGGHNPTSTNQLSAVMFSPPKSRQDGNDSLDISFPVRSFGPNDQGRSIINLDVSEERGEVKSSNRNHPVVHAPNASFFDTSSEV